MAQKQNFKINNKKLLVPYLEKIVILGFSFKENTNDTRESAAIQICTDLLNEGANLLIHDPKVNASQIQADLNKLPTDKIFSHQDNKSSLEGNGLI